MARLALALVLLTACEAQTVGTRSVAKKTPNSGDLGRESFENETQQEGRISESSTSIPQSTLSWDGQTSIEGPTLRFMAVE